MGFRGGGGGGAGTGAKACCVMRPAPFGVCIIGWTGAGVCAIGVPGAGVSGAWLASSPILPLTEGLGDKAEAAGLCWLTALRRPVGPRADGATDSLLREPADVSGVCEPEPPRPPTWIVIFLDWPAGVDSAVGTLSLILDCGGSGTAALASSNCSLKYSFARVSIDT